MRTSCFAFALAAIFATGCTTRPETVADLPPMDSPGTKYTLLPTPVQRTITAMGGASEIRDINKIGQPIQDVYEVQFANPVKNPTLYVALDGSLVNASVVKTNSPPNNMVGPTPTGRALAGVVVPEPVQRTLQLQEPTATVANIQPRSHTFYEVSFEDPVTHPTVLIAEDGSVWKKQ